MDSHLNRSEIQEARLKGKGASIRFSHSLKMEMLYVAFPLGDQKQPKGYIRLSRSLQEVTSAIHPLRQMVMQDLYWIVFFSLLIALLFSHRLISPIRKLAAFTEKARTGNISGQIRIESRDEIGALAENINGMVEVLHEKIRNADEERRKVQAVFTGMVEGIVVLDHTSPDRDHQPRNGGDDRFPIRRDFRPDAARGLPEHPAPRRPEAFRGDQREGRPGDHAGRRTTGCSGRDDLRRSRRRRRGSRKPCSCSTM